MVRHWFKLRAAFMLMTLASIAPQASALTAQTITGFTPTTPIIYSTGQTFTLGAKGGASGSAVIYASTTTTVCTVSGSKVSVLAVGTCNLTANQAGNTTYAAAPQVSATVVINQAAQAITFAVLSAKTYGAASFALAAKASSTLTVAYTSTTTSVCTVSGATVTLVGVGTCTIDANQAGNADFTAAAQVVQSFAVGQEAQTITFAALAAKSYGAAPFTLTAKASSTLAVTYTSTTPSVCTISSSTVNLVGVGTCTIDANQAGNANFSPAAQVVQSFAVADETQKITFAALTSKIYGAAPITLSATASSGLPVLFTSATPLVCSVSGASVSLVGVGTCTIDANQPGNADIGAATQVAQSFAVAKAAQTISFAALSASTYGATFSLSATSSSGLPLTFKSATTAVCTVSGATVTLVGLGTCTVDANQAGNADFNAATQVVQSFVVTKEAQTITFGVLAAQTLGAAPFTISASATSGLPVSFASSTTPVCTVSGSTVTFINSGTCTIVATQSGNANISAAPQVTQSFLVSAKNQTISFTALPGLNLGSAPFTLSATSTSGLPVIFSSMTAPVCAVAGSTVTLVSAGRCTIAADQSGNNTYTAAPEVTQSFTVAPGIQTISYVYDATGRAVQVVDTSGVNSQFSYDAVGNIAAVANTTANTLRITEFTPTSGSPGTPVTISGSGYDSTAANNIVTFNGVAATVTSATSTALSVVVPASATTGIVSISNGNGNVVSAASFAVGPSLVAGGVPDAVNLVANQPKTLTFFGTAGQGLTIGFTGVSLGGFNATVSLPNGSSLQSCGGIISDSNCPLPYLPVTGIYTVNLLSGSSATASLSLLPDVLGVLAANILSNFTVTNVDQAATYTFAGTVGQTIQLVFSADSIYGNTQIQLYGPNGAYLQSTNINAIPGALGSGIMTIANLAATGTYSVRLLTPTNIATGKINILMAPSGAGSLTIDGAPTPVSLNIGEVGVYSFSGTAGQNIGLGITTMATAPSGASLSIKITDPSGNAVASYIASGTNSGTVIPTLISTGNYTVTVNPGLNAATFNMQLSSDITASIGSGTVAAVFATSKVGQAGTYTFNGTAGQDLQLFLSADTLPGVTSVYVFQSTGALLATTSIRTATSTTLPLTNLPATGLYSVRVQPLNGAIGNLTLSFQQVVSGTLTVDSGAATASLAATQIGNYTFNGAAGQSLSVGIIGLPPTPATASMAVTISDPSGKQIASFSATGGTSAYMLPVLATSGAYTISVSPGANAASFTMALHSDVMGTLAANGPAASFTTSTVGQAGSYTFSATAGQNIDLLLSGDTFAGKLNASVYQPNGQLLSTFIANYSGVAASSTLAALNNLPATGNYIVRLVSPTGAAGIVSLSLPTALTGSIAVGGAATSENQAVGQHGNYTFTGSAGQLLGLGLTSLATSPTNGTVNVTIFDPSGKQFGSFAAVGANTGYALPMLTTAGNYTVLVDAGTNAATYNLQVNPDLTGVVSVNGSSATFSPTAIGQAGSYTFNGIAGQSLSVLINNDTLPGWSNYVVTGSNGSFIGQTPLYWSTGTPGVALIGLPVLTVTDTYTIRAIPGNAIGSASLSVLSVAAGGTLSVDGAPIAANIADAQVTRYTFNATAGQLIAVDLSALTTMPANASIFVSINDPTGYVVASFWTTGSTYEDVLPILTASGTYSIVVTPNTNAATFNIQLASKQVGVVTVDGGTTPFATTAPGQGRGVFTFNGTAGQDLGLLISGNTFASALISVTQPNGQIVYPPQTNAPIIPSSTSVSWSGRAVASSGSLELASLPATGTYTIQVLPQIGATGILNLSLSSEVTNTLTINGSGTNFTLAPGQVGKFTFSGTGGQNIGLGLSASAANTITVTDPLSSTIAALTTTAQTLTTNQQALGTNVIGMSLPTLATPGQYTIMVYANATGGNFTLWATTGLNGTVVVSNATNSVGTLVNQTSITTASPGQQAIFSFNGTAGQNLSLLAAIPSPACSVCNPNTPSPGGAQGVTTYSVYSPSGTFLGSLLEQTAIALAASSIPASVIDPSGNLTVNASPLPASTGNGGGGGGTGAPPMIASTANGWMPLLNLPQTGTYTVVADTTIGLPGIIGAVSVEPYASGTVTVDGAPTVTNLAFGQGIVYTFNGTAGQQLGLDVLFSTPIPVTLMINDPNGNLIGTYNATTAANEANYALPTLAMSGAYTIIVNPFGAAMTLNVTLSSNTTAAMTPNGAATNFVTSRSGQDAIYTFAGAVGQNLDIGITGVTMNPSVGTATVTIHQPGGSNIATMTITAGSSSGTQLPTLTQAGTYSMTINDGATASITNLNVLLSTDLLGTLSIDGPVVPVAINRVGQAATYSFSATAGQTLSLAMTGDTYLGQTNFIITQPNGSVFASSNMTFNGVGSGSVGSMLLTNLPVTGTYAVRILPNNGATGSVSLTLESEVNGAIANNSSMAINLEAGQQASYTFNGTIGQTFDLALTGVTTTPSGGNVTLTVMNPDNTTMSFFSASDGSAAAMLLAPLTQTGTFSMVVSASGGDAAKLNVSMSTDVMAALTLDGPSVPVVLSLPGQAATYTFSGTAGQTVSLLATGDTIPGKLSINVTQPNGTPWANSDNINYSGSGPAAIGSLLLLNLPATGTYTVRLIPNNGYSGSGATGSISMALESAAGGTITVNSSTVVNLTTGQQGIYTFTGAVGQTLDFALTGLTTTPSGGSVTLSVANPDGSVLTSFSNTSGTNVSLPAALTQAGTYILTVTPTSGYAANVNVVVSTEVLATMAVDGPAVPVTISLPGQAATYSFNGTAGQILSLLLTGVTIPSRVSINVYQPNGTLLVSDDSITGSVAGAIGSLVLSNLPATGTYTVRLTPNNGWFNIGATGSVSMALESEANGTVSINSSTLINLEGGQEGTYTFTGAVGQFVDFALVGSTTTPSGGTVTLSVANPDGSILTSFSSTGGTSVNLPAALMQAGAYTITVTATSGYAASSNLVLSTDALAALIPNGPSVPVTLSLPGQAATYSFSGTAGQTLNLSETANTIPGNTQINVYQPDGSLFSASYIIHGGTATGSITLTNLPMTGTYTARIFPNNGNYDTGATGSFSIGLSE